MLLFDNYKHNHNNKSSLGACPNVRCEVCGRKIYGKPYTALIEGAKLTVCAECSKHGKIIEEKPKTAVTRAPLKMKPIRLPPLKTQSKEKTQKTVKSTSELVENFYAKVRQAREKLGLSHEELGKRINEKVSRLRKIETGKMVPDDMLATKLEHALKIKLLVPATEQKVPKIPKPSSRELTLGDLIKLDKNKAEGKP